MRKPSVRSSRLLDCTAEIFSPFLCVHFTYGLAIKLCVNSITLLMKKQYVSKPSNLNSSNAPQKKLISTLLKTMLNVPHFQQK